MLRGFEAELLQRAALGPEGGDPEGVLPQADAQRLGRGGLPRLYHGGGVAKLLQDRGDTNSSALNGSTPLHTAYTKASTESV